MPMTYEIDRGRKLVIAQGTGDLTMADIFAYHEEVWTRPDVVGFDEVVDFSRIADNVGVPSNDIIKLAKKAAAKDADTGSRKLAIVAKGDLFYGLGRMYQVYRETAEDSQKKVGVFRTMEEAMAWIKR